MLKKFTPLLFIFLFTTCGGVPTTLSSFFTSSSVTYPDAFFSTTTAESGLVFIGAVGRRSNPKETVQLALLNAAKQVAIFYDVSGEYAVESSIGSGAFDYIYNTYTSLHFNEEDAAQYIDALQFDADKDTIEIENTFFIRTTYPSSLPSPVNYRIEYSGANKKPDWVDNPPSEIQGYEVGVGFSGRYSSMADTYRNSCKNAIFTIIRNVNSVSKSSDLLYSNTSNLFGYKTANDNITYSFGRLNGFYILDTWIDPAAKTIWTLAIARKAD